MIVRASTIEERIAAISFIAPRVGETPESLVWQDRWEALCAVPSGRLAGVVVYNNWRGRSIETHWAGLPGWLTRANLRGIFAFPFDTLGCRRVTGIIRRNNRTARRVAEKIGFKLEGVAREGFEDGTDAMIYGMVRNDCRWI
tara:strand:- start:249 stop:674 length:426 start_codon:yes stop_codon:yes gene_type:complete